jgi:hypothetical protein
LCSKNQDISRASGKNHVALSNGTKFKVRCDVVQKSDKNRQRKTDAKKMMHYLGVEYIFNGDIVLIVEGCRIISAIVHNLNIKISANKNLETQKSYSTNRNEDK